MQPSLVDLVVEGPLGELKQGKYLVEGHAELVLRVGDEIDEREDVAIVVELGLFAAKELLVLEEGVFIMAADLPEQVLLFRLPMLEVSQPLSCIFLEDFELVDELLVVSVEVRRRAHAHIQTIINSRWQAHHINQNCSFLLLRLRLLRSEEATKRCRYTSSVCLFTLLFLVRYRFSFSSSPL